MRNLVVSAALAALVSTPASAAYLIDEFSSGAGSFSSSYASQELGDVLGGVRDTGIIYPGRRATIAGGVATLETAPPTDWPGRGSVSFRYDGVLGEGNVSKLGFDVTDGGRVDRFLVDIASIIDGNPRETELQIEIGLYDTDGALQLLGVTTAEGSGVFSIRFDTFFEFGLVSTLDWTNVGAIKIGFNMLQSTMPVVVDAICAGDASSINCLAPAPVSEPGSLAILLLALTGLGGATLGAPATSRREPARLTNRGRGGEHRG